MSTDDWKYWKVTMVLHWMSGADVCDATLTTYIHAKSAGHAISRVKDRLRNIGLHEVEEASAKEERTTR